MNKRATTLIVSLCLIVIIATLFVSIPKENWSVMPYILFPLLLACLVAVVFSTIHLIKKTPEIREKVEPTDEDKAEPDTTPKETDKTTDANTKIQDISNKNAENNTNQNETITK